MPARFPPFKKFFRRGVDESRALGRNLRGGLSAVCKGAETRGREFGIVRRQGGGRFKKVCRGGPFARFRAPKCRVQKSRAKNSRYGRFLWEASAVSGDESFPKARAFGKRSTMISALPSGTRPMSGISGGFGRWMAFAGSAEGLGRPARNLGQALGSQFAIFLPVP